MKTVDLDSWNDFANAIADVRTEFGTRTIADRDGNSITRECDVIFRGQASNEWQLSSTLERTTDQTYSVPRYVERATSVLNEIESITGKKWDIPSYPDLLKEIETVQDSMRVYLPCYDYLVYLRHHGFPSPFLDWSRSPYVAAYFAMEGPANTERCSVYAFIEHPEGGKALTGGHPRITGMGRYVTTHTRHFAQKAQYTIATLYDRDRKLHEFVSHHDVKSPIPNSQDVLINITIPRSDRESALRQLEDFNINHYTLYQSEDALIRSLALRSIELDGT